MSKTINFYLLALLCLSFCGSYKNISYYQKLNSSKPPQENVKNHSSLTIQPADILGIKVNSRNPESSSVFNYNLNRVNRNNFDNSTNRVMGYLADEKGEIEPPLIGTLKVPGHTTPQLRKKIKPILLMYYKDPLVTIRLLNFNRQIKSTFHFINLRLNSLSSELKPPPKDIEGIKAVRDLSSARIPASAGLLITLVAG